MNRTEKTVLALRRYFPLLLIVASVVWGGWYIYGHPAELTSIQGLSPGWLIALFCLSVAKIACMGSFTRVIVRSLEIDLGFLEWFGLSALSTMGNYLTPFRGGAVVRAMYLKSKHDLPYSLFLSTLSALYVITFATNAALGVLAMLALYLWIDFVDVALLSFFLALCLLPVVLLILLKVIPRLPDKDWSKRYVVLQITAFVGRIIEGWRVISARKSTVLQLLALSVLNSSVTLLMIHLSFVAFGVRLPLIESLVLSSLFMISSMIPLTPSGLGVAEVVLVLVSRGFGVQEMAGIFSTGLNRSVMILSSIMWGSLFSYILGRRAVLTEDKP
ncbi:MAG: flippase-like domain-containing protein [Chloroflexi bacterium]|nr:flippase-like domain-containing protein [Chloroflexota bacterium]